MEQDNIKERGIKTMNIDHENGYGAEAQNLWEESEQLKFIQDLKVGKSVAEIMGQLDTAQAFAEKSKVLGCSDGRICDHRLGGAGNFILASEDDQEKFIRENQGKIKAVKSHDGCGAAAIKFKQMAEAGQALPAGVTKADDLGKYFSRDLAGKLAADYGHTTSTEMSGTVHNERAIYFDGTGKFNPRALPDMPAGFMCSGPALGLSSKYCEEELATLAKIALGDHGFGQRFNKDNPLYIIVSAYNQEQLNQLRKIANRAVSQFDGIVAVDGFIAQ